jgi:hypothetical protein
MFIKIIKKLLLCLLLLSSCVILGMEKRCLKTYWDCLSKQENLQEIYNQMQVLLENKDSMKTTYLSFLPTEMLCFTIENLLKVAVQKEIDDVQQDINFYDGALHNFWKRSKKDNI